MGASFSFLELMGRGGGRGKPCDCHVMWSRKNLSHMCCQGSGQQLRGATVRRKHPLFIQSLLCEVFFCFESVNRSVVSNSLQHHGLTVACQAPLSMDFPGKNTGVGSHSFLQRIFFVLDQINSFFIPGDP